MENINFRILPTAFRYLAGFFRQNVFSQVQRPRAALERLHRSAPEPADDPPAYRPPKKVPPLATSREDTVRNRDRRVAGPGGKHRRDENGAAKSATEGLGTAPRNRNGRCGTGRDRNGRRGTGMRATAAVLATPRATAALFVTRRATAKLLATHSAMAAAVATPLEGGSSIAPITVYGCIRVPRRKREPRSPW